MTWSLAFVSIHPKLIEAYRNLGVLRAAEAAKIADISAIDLRDFAADKHASIDAAPYGGGDGMVMRPDCLADAVEHVFAHWGRRGRVVFTTPSGKLWTQEDAAQFAETQEPTVFICGRFAGVDQRFIDQYVTDEYSIGDFVLAGGELPSLMMAESALRLIPGVLGNAASAVDDSFGEGMNGMLEYPLYTRPPSWQGKEVPSVLTGGNHDAIKKWRHAESVKRTTKLRPELLKK